MSCVYRLTARKLGNNFDTVNIIHYSIHVRALFDDDFTFPPSIRNEETSM